MNAPRRALITGADGQLGIAVRRATPPGWEAVGWGRGQLDVTRPDQVLEAVRRERPALIVHAAAYTAVDTAEQEIAAAEAVNAEGARHVAQAAREVGARLVNISTDYVFDGARGYPYSPQDATNPLNVYGRSKLAGEREVARQTDDGALTIRTAWLYSAHRHNFALTMLRLMREQPEVAVVSDQVGTPTSTGSLAGAIWAAAERPELRGVHHWTDSGVASRYDFAVAIQEEALALGLLERMTPIRPIRSDERPTAATRPPYSVLDCGSIQAELGLVPEHWRVNLRRMLREVAAA